MRSEREERPENRDGVPVEAGRSQSTGRLLLLLVDVVAYSRMMSIQQLQSVRLLHDVWREAGCPDAKGMFSPPRSPISIGDGFIFAGEDKASVAEAFFNYIQSLCTRLDALPQQDRFSVRFAAHSGDCWIIEDNILGSGVNDLCRFAQCAVSGQILFSRAFWHRLWFYRDAGELNVNLSRVFFDQYRVQFKHDEWDFFGTRAELRTAPDEDRLASSVLIEVGDTSASVLGVPSVPANAVDYTAFNNYHGVRQFSFPGFVRCPEGEMYWLYGTEANERLMCVTYRGLSLRLPYYIEFALHEDIELSLIEQDNVSKLVRTDDTLKRLHDEYTRSCVRDPCTDLNEELYGLTEMNLKRAGGKVSVVLSGVRCERGYVVNLALSPDWAPSADPTKGAPSVRQILAGRGGFPWTQTQLPALPARVCVAVQTSCGRLVWTRQLPPEGGESRASPAVMGYVRFDEPPSDPEELATRLGRQPFRVDRAMKRIVCDGLRISMADISSCSLLGAARNLWHLGSPDFFYLVKVARSVKELREAGERTGLWSPQEPAGDCVLSLSDRAVRVLASTVFSVESMALAFFVIARARDNAGPGPLGTGGQNWKVDPPPIAGPLQELVSRQRSG